MKKKFYYLGAIGLAIGVILAGCGSDNTDTSQSQPTTSDDSTETSTGIATSSEGSENPDTDDSTTNISQDNVQKVAIRTPMDFSDDNGGEVTITITNIQKDMGDEIEKPTGPYFVKADFAVENKGTTSFQVNAADFSIYDGEKEKGEVVAKDFALEDVAAGKKYSGSIYFDIKNDGPFEIYFADVAWLGQIK